MLFCALFFHSQELALLDWVPQGGNDVPFLFCDVNGIDLLRRHEAPSLRAGGIRQNL